MTRRAECMDEPGNGGAEQVLDLLAAVTATVCEAVAGGEFDRAARLLDERGRLIKHLESLHRGAGQAGPRVTARIAALRDLDEKMSAALGGQRKNVLEKLQDAEKRKAIRAYQQ